MEPMEDHRQGRLRVHLVALTVRGWPAVRSSASLLSSGRPARGRRGRSGRCVRRAKASGGVIHPLTGPP
jgi:hypothetical protein